MKQSENSISSFDTLKKHSALFGYIAIKKGYATVQQVKYALAKQQHIFREKQTKKMIGDMLVESGVLTKEQQQIISKEQRLVIAGKNAAKERDKEEKSDSENIEIAICANVMEAWVKIASYSNAAVDDVSLPDTANSNIQNSTSPSSDVPETTRSEKPNLLVSIKFALKNINITNGILSDSILQCHIDRKDTFFLAAIGEYHYSHLPEYQFNIDKFVNGNPLLIDSPISGDTSIKRGNTLAHLKHSKVEIKIQDVYGKLSIWTGGYSPLLLRCGRWVSVSEDGSSVLSEQSGYPALSIEGKLYIFPVINVLADADTHFGKIAPYSRLHVSGVLTGAYSVTAGQVVAGEIRGANVVSIGNVSAQVGIIDSRIKTQGSVKAKYIHNSRIEAFGDVVVEHEIIDSTIIISGACNAAGGRVIGSKISAKMGVTAAGIGSNVTEPCLISVGYEEHTVLKSLEITRKIKSITKELSDLTVQKQLFEQEIKDIFKQMVELKLAHDRAKSRYVELNENIDNALNREKKEQTDNILEEIKKSMEESVDALKKYNQQKKGLEILLAKTDSSIIKIKTEVEQKILELEIDRNRFLKWAESKEPKPEIRVSGRLSEGTIIKGVFSSMVVHEELKSVQLVERRVGIIPESSEIRIIPLRGKNRHE